MELGRWVSDERRDNATLNLKNAPIQDRLPEKFPDFKGESRYFGQVFSSGGTSGEPKSVFFEEEAFQKTAELLARGYASGGGIREGMVVANLFVAGNMWSSFLAVDRALQSLRTVRLPIGGLSEPEFIVRNLLKFQPDAIVGLPSLLISIAQKMEREGHRLTAKTILYAGEHLTQSGRSLLERVFGTTQIQSAGYASVDAGPIGYSCGKIPSREHHVFEDAVHLEILNGEGVVTSLIRRAMPVVRLRTGDHLEWTSEPGEVCACGSKERRFLLHGRVDGQIRIWSSRILLSEIESAFGRSEIDAPIFQVEVREDDESEKLKIHFENENIQGSIPGLRVSFFEEARDLKATQSLGFIQDRLEFVGHKPGSLPRVPRTGKVRPVVDYRKI
jgi:phenylacetate-coenzyme A ligase PaaK-like adenylate-forming protein